MKAEEFLTVKKETIVSLICNIIGAVFSFFGFMSNGFSRDLFFLSLMIAVMLTIPMLYINIRNKRKKRRCGIL